jgi:hypothetical protein
VEEYDKLIEKCKNFLGVLEIIKKKDLNIRVSVFSLSQVEIKKKEFESESEKIKKEHEEAKASFEKAKKEKIYFVKQRKILKKEIIEIVKNEFNLLTLLELNGVDVDNLIRCKEEEIVKVVKTQKKLEDI